MENPPFSPLLLLHSLKFDSFGDYIMGVTAGDVIFPGKQKNLERFIPMANKTQSRSIVGTIVLRPQKPTTGHVTKRRVGENVGAAASPAKNIKAIIKNEVLLQVEVQVLLTPLVQSRSEKTNKMLMKAHVAVQLIHNHSGLYPESVRDKSSNFGTVLGEFQPPSASSMAATMAAGGVAGSVMDKSLNFGTVLGDFQPPSVSSMEGTMAASGGRGGGGGGEIAISSPTFHLTCISVISV
ncbi:hypothetical protein AgCh_022827 [Apium graveolens]